MKRTGADINFLNVFKEVIRSDLSYLNSKIKFAYVIFYFAIHCKLKYVKNKKNLLKTSDFQNFKNGSIFCECLRYKSYDINNINAFLFNVRQN